MSVTCPHCQTQLLNDGTLQGQWVVCPHCQGRLQIPPEPVAPPLVQQSQPPLAITTSSGYRRASSRIRNRKKQSIPTATKVTLLLLVATICFVIAGIGRQIANPTSGLNASAYYKAGYEHGESTGTFHREIGAGPDMTLPYLSGRKVPDRGTPEFGDYSRGYEDGYLDGYY